MTLCAVCGRRVGYCMYGAVAALDVRCDAD